MYNFSFIEIMFQLFEIVKCAWLWQQLWQINDERPLLQKKAKK